MRVSSNKNSAMPPCKHAEIRVNYQDTYSLVVSWMSVRVVITLSILRKIQTNSVYFVLAYTQYDVKAEMFLELPIGFGVEGDHPI